MDDLSNKEKDELASRLSYSATVGGWTFVGFGLFTITLFLLPLTGIIDAQFEYDDEFIGAFIPLTLAFLLPAAWLLRRRNVIRTQLDGALQPATGIITKIDHTNPSRGIFIYLEVTTPSLTVEQATLHGYELPSWSVGEEIELLFLPDNGRFFPRHLNHKTNMGRIFTPRQQRRQRGLKLVASLILGLLILFGIAVSIVNG